MRIPRPEHPRPQFQRESWSSLNGIWEFEMDPDDTGMARGLHEGVPFTKQITVPFCMESALSGMGHKDFVKAVWYRRTIEVDGDHVSGRVLLHFGAVDYHCVVWVNGSLAGQHSGGYSSFQLDVTTLLKPGINTITVRAFDDTRSSLQPSGKQSTKQDSEGCFYTRVTGIWQTVWLEFVPRMYLRQLRLTPDVGSGVAHVQISIEGSGISDDVACVLRASYRGKSVAEATVNVMGDHAFAALALAEMHLWDVGKPELYDLELELRQDGRVVDRVASYFGMRSLAWREQTLCLNGRPVFQKLVLDQGYYPDGIYTAPTDDALRRDIELAMALGFNGARLHEKVFEERFLYWADKLGYLVWGEYPNWGLDVMSPRSLEIMLPEWLEVVRRDFNHPSIVGWCPFNETWENDRRATPLGLRGNGDDTIRAVYRATKAVDPTRPVIDTSGAYHVETDVFDVHEYTQNPDELAAKLGADSAYVNFADKQMYEGQAYMVSEYGGAWWDPNAVREGAGSWGYGERPRTEAEFAERYVGLTRVLMENRYVSGFCYTQLYDVEQEQNGLYTYDRKPKFSDDVYERIRRQNGA